MEAILTCYSLFDITSTNVLNRHRPDMADDKEWLYKRSTQANFDTILQVISLRTQPDILIKPVRKDIRFDEFNEFGFLYEQEGEKTYPSWTFDFSINHPSVFNDGIHDLGSLFRDSQGVPMILCGTEYDKLQPMLDTTEELRNIYFKFKYAD
jgi:hypothetical protein